MKSLSIIAALLLLACCLPAVLGFITAFPSTSESDNFRSTSRSSARSLEDLPPNWSQNLDEFIANVTRCQGIIGLSVSVVYANQSIYAKGFGTTTLGGSTPVDADTMFSIGSTTKAFTSTLLAILIDEGYFPQGWDTKVTSIAKDFEFYSQVEGQFLSIRDLLSMKAGISLQPLLMFRNGTRKDALYKFQYAAPAMEMRTNFLYANWMIVLAGHLAEIVTGQDWETLIQTKILAPLGMKASTPYFSQVYAGSNWAMPYAWSVDGSNEWVPLNEINEGFQMVGPAGSMSTSANDIAPWLLLHLNQGTFANTSQQLVSAKNLGECHNPQFLMQESPFRRVLPVNHLTNANEGYGFGWMKDNIEGRDMYWHNGEVFGFLSEMAFMPNEGIGIFTSQTGGYISETTLYAIRLYIMNTIIGLDTSFLSNICPTSAKQPKPTEVHSNLKHPVHSTAKGTSHIRHGARPNVPHTGTESTVRLEKGVQRFVHKKHDGKAKTAHKKHHAVFDPTPYLGTYNNIIYDNLQIQAISESEAKSMFPHHPTGNSPITMVLNWQVLSMGLSDMGDGINFNCTLAAPYNLVLFQVLQNGAIFLKDSTGAVNGMYWLADDYYPPKFNKTA